MSAHQNKTSDPTLTLQTDTIKTKAKNAVFDAPLVSQVATLQTGDSIIDTGIGGTLNATFNPVATNIVGAAIQGVSTWNLTNEGTFNFGNGNIQLITGGSLISGLSTLNDVNSNAPIIVGVTGASLQSALTTVGMTNTDSSLSVLIAASALSGVNDSVAVNFNNAGIVGSFAQLTIGPDNNATNGYENWNISITGNNSVALSDGSATSATTMTIFGSGSITLNLDASFANLTTINVSATGTVTISLDPPVGQAGHLTVVKGGSGNDTFDLSDAAYTPAVINAMTTLDGGTGTAELILNNSVLTTTVALTTPKHFQIFGDTDPSGTVNMALLPSSIKEIEFAGGQAGALSINNAPAIFTLDAQQYATNEITINAADTAATTNILSILMGSNQGLSTFDAGPIVVTGFGTVNISTIGTAGIDVDASPLYPASNNTFAANPGGTELVNITGTAPLSFDGPVILTGTSTTINDTNSAAVYILSTNAAVINAASSGGLNLGTDTNYSGATGDVITGSTTAANSLGGSLGNDVITASVVGGDTITTNGGADTIILNAHAVGDTISFNGYNPTGFAIGSSIVNFDDQTQAGFWGVAASGAGGGIVPNASTSADQSIINNFNAGSGVGADILQFPTGAWSNLLTYGDGQTAISSSFASIDAAAANATLSATANVIEITGANFANASALATALGSTYNLTFAGAGVAANKDVHMLFTYNDPSGNAHVADVDFENGSTAATTTAAVTKIVASDMVELVGVSATSLTAHNIHFV